MVVTRAALEINNAKARADSDLTAVAGRVLSANVGSALAPDVGSDLTTEARTMTENALAPASKISGGSFASEAQCVLTLGTNGGLLCVI